MEGQVQRQQDLPIGCYFVSSFDKITLRPEDTDRKGLKHLLYFLCSCHRMCSVHHMLANDTLPCFKGGQEIYLKIWGLCDENDGGGRRHRVFRSPESLKP